MDSQSDLLPVRISVGRGADWSMYIVTQRRRLICLECRIYVRIKMTVMSKSPFFYALNNNNSNSIY